MRLLIVLIILLFGINQVYPQDAAYLFKNYLPTNIGNNEEYMNMISQNINKLAAINPDLIYYYITELKYKFDKSLERRDRLSAIHEIQKIKLKYYNQRNTWAQSQINILTKLKLSQRTYEYSIDYFDDLIVKNLKQIESEDLKLLGENENKRLNKNEIDITLDSTNVTDEFKLEVDSSMMNYFAVSYYENTIADNFDSEKNYRDIKYEIELKLIQEYYNALKVENTDTSKIDLYSFLSNWYLFNKNTDEKFNIDATEYVSQVVSFRHRKALPTGIFIGINYSKRLFPVEIQDKIYIYGMDDKININKYFNLLRGIINVSAGFQLQLKKELSWLSYVKIKFGISQSKDSQQINFKAGFLQDEYTDDLTKIYRKLEFFKNEINIQSLKSYFVNISTPIYTISNRMYLEAGVLFEYLQYKYKLSYSYHYIHYNSYLLPFGGWYIEGISDEMQEILNEPSTYENFIFFPTIGVRFRLTKNLFIYAGSIPSSISFELSYNFN